MARKDVPFAVQRIICFALLLGMTIYAIIAAVLLQSNEGAGLGDAPIPALDTAAIVIGVAAAIAGIALRVVLRSRAESLDGAARSGARFQSVLIPLALLEGACLFALTVWLLNGTAVPGLAVSLVLLALAIAIVPFSDPDAGAASGT